MPCRHGIAKQTFYSWKAKFGRLTVDETRRLMHLIADLTLDNQVLGGDPPKALTPPRGKPDLVVIDNGPEFAGRVLDK